MKCMLYGGPYGDEGKEVDVSPPLPPTIRVPTLDLEVDGDLERDRARFGYVEFERVGGSNHYQCAPSNPTPSPDPPDPVPGFVRCELVIRARRGSPEDPDRHVAWVQIPRFRQEPDVLLWGTRVFYWVYGGGGEDPIHKYCEVFAYVVPS